MKIFQEIILVSFILLTRSNEASAKEETFSKKHVATSFARRTGNTSEIIMASFYQKRDRNHFQNESTTAEETETVQSRSSDFSLFQKQNNTLVINGVNYTVYQFFRFNNETTYGNDTSNAFPIANKPTNNVALLSQTAPQGKGIKGCTFKNASGGIAVYCVNVSINKIASELPVHTKFLDIISVNETVLRTGILSHLSQLENLRITWSRVRFVTPSFFRNLNKLRTLALDNNMIKVLSNKTFETTPNLEYFSMRSNIIITIKTFASALKPLGKLKIFDMSNNLIVENVYADSFLPLSNNTLQELNLAECQIRRIEKDAFRPLRNLRVLDIGSNHFNAEALLNLTLSMKWTDIRSLGLSSLSEVTRTVLFPKKELLPLQMTRIEDLDMSSNYFPQIREFAFPNLTTLNSLNLRFCSIELIFDNAFDNLTNLRVLNLQENRIYSISSAITSITTLRRLALNNYQKKGRTVQFLLKENELSSLRQLQSLSMSSVPILGVIKKEYFAGLDLLTDLDLHACAISGVADYSFADLQLLVTLDLSYNLITNISNNTLHGLQSLKILNLNGNNIFIGPFVSPFMHLYSLESLLINNNKIDILYSDMFFGLQNLSLLHLSNNAIKPWSRHVFSFTPKLEVLIMYSNEISHVTATMLNEFRSLQAFNLRNNPFQCDICGMKDFQDWLLTTDTIIADKNYNDSYICVSPSQLEGLSIFNVTIPTEHCLLKTLDVVLVATVSVVIPMMLIGAIAFAVYYLRWYIRYYIFLVRTHVHKYRISASNKTYEFDAFVSYCATESQWVIGQLVPILEGQNYNLKLCLHDRDFEVGRLITDNIMQSIENSRKTVLILSEAYVSSKWCMLELHMAQHRLFDDTRDALVLVELKELDKNTLPKTLKYLVKTRTYIPWTTNLVGQKLFWERLKEVLKKPADCLEMKRIV